MKIAHFGSTGSIGQLVMKQALADGHEIVAFTRDPSKIDSSHDRLTPFQGDINDLEAVKSACKGVDAVICTLGMPLLDNSKLRSTGTKNIVDAMTAVGVDRLICLSSMGVGDSHALLPIKFKYFIGPLLMRRLFADHTAQENHIRASKLDWTILRPGNFTDKQITGVPRHGFTVSDPKSKAIVRRTDVADFILSQLTSKLYIKQSPSLSY